MVNDLYWLLAEEQVDMVIVSVFSNLQRGETWQNSVICEHTVLLCSNEYYTDVFMDTIDAPAVY